MLHFNKKTVLPPRNYLRKSANYSAKPYLKKSLPRTLINGHPVRQAGKHNLQKPGNEEEVQTIPTIVNGVTMKTNSKYNMEISGTPIDPINDCIDNSRDTINLLKPNDIYTGCFTTLGHNCRR